MALEDEKEDKKDLTSSIKEIFTFRLRRLKKRLERKLTQPRRKSKREIRPKV